MNEERQTSSPGESPSRQYERRNDGRMIGWLYAACGGLLSILLALILMWVSSIEGRVTVLTGRVNAIEARSAVYEAKLDLIHVNVTRLLDGRPK